MIAKKLDYNQNLLIAKFYNGLTRTKKLVIKERLPLMVRAYLVFF